MLFSLFSVSLEVNKSPKVTPEAETWRKECLMYGHCLCHCGSGHTHQLAGGMGDGQQISERLQRSERALQEAQCSAENQPARGGGGRESRPWKN